MQEPKLICGDCGAEVKQLGAMLKCQNRDCQMQIPIDLDEINREAAIAGYNSDHQISEV